MTRQFHRFYFALFVAAIAPLGLVAACNWLINPYGVFAAPEIVGVNHLKPEQKNLARIYKAFDLRRKQPEVILFGSSRVEEGLNIEHPALVGKDNYQLYNAGFQAGNPYEILKYLELAIAKNPQLKKVVLGVDFFMFNENLLNQETFSEARLKSSYPVKDALSFLVSFDALTSSKDTVLVSRQNSEPSKQEEQSLKSFQFWIKEFLRNEQLYAEYKFSENKLANFRQIVELCQQNQIELTVFISPLHVTLLETINVAGLWSEFESWKQAISSITPVWDFAYYNSVTTETVQTEMSHYLDSSHYSQETGDLVLKRIFNTNLIGIPLDFGRLVTSENIKQHLATSREQRASWRQTQPPEVKLVRQITTKSK